MIRSCITSFDSNRNNMSRIPTLPTMNWIVLFATQYSSTIHNIDCFTLFCSFFFTRALWSFTLCYVEHYLIIMHVVCVCVCPQSGLVVSFAPQVAWVQGPWWTYFTPGLRVAIYHVPWWKTLRAGDYETRETGGHTRCPRCEPRILWQISIYMRVCRLMSFRKDSSPESFPLIPTSDIQIQDPLRWSWSILFKVTKNQVFWILFVHPSSGAKWTVEKSELDL